MSFIDCGSNFESVSCPTCGTDLDQWWPDAVNSAFEASHFAELAVTLPCCGVAASLNDLKYEWPAGFARFVLEVVEPHVGELGAEIVARLEHIFGGHLRIIWAHY